ncbi:MAG: hypothetical protein M1541_00305 [Acidobacteria bacterium]|nr:hypothetical protein [Acidobacteriota bacterium]
MSIRTTRRGFLAGGMILTALPPARAGNGADLASTFTDPPKAFSPVPLWWWSGEPLERKRLRWQLEQLAKGGVYNVCVINLAPASPWAYCLPDSPRFFSDDWWKMFRGVCEDARELGMYVWFYDQIGFSSANIHGTLIRERPEFKASWLRSAAGEKPASAEEIRRPAGNRAFYATRSGFNYLDPAACRELLRRIHGQFEKHAGEFFGKVIVGSFQDELGRMPTWTGKFAAEFRRRKGYDLLEYLPAVFEDRGAESLAVRADYQQVRAALAEEAFFKPLFDWHEQRGLICGYDQTNQARLGDPAGSTALYADYPRTNRWYQAPGSDHGGETKIHSSFAHLYQRKRVWLEAFHSSGWGGTLEETFDWLLMKIRAGATLYNPHAVYYSTWGGWWEWAPPSTCWRQPYWRHYPLFSKAVSRLCATLSQGKHIADVAVLYPVATMQAHSLPDSMDKAAAASSEVYHALVGRMDITRSRIEVGVLDGDRRDFDVIDDDSVARATIKRGSLTVAGESYRAVVLPGCSILTRETAEALCRFVESGGTLVAVAPLPETAAGLKADSAPVRVLRGLIESGKARQVQDPRAVPGLLRHIPRRVEAPVPTLMRRAGGNLMLFVPAAHPGATEFAPGHHYTFDARRYRRGMTIRVRGVKSAPELWDPLSGRREPVEARAAADGVEIVIPFANGPAALLVWPEAQARTPGRPGSSERELQTLTGPWDIRLESTLDNTYGDFAKPNGASIPLQTWDFEHRVEPGTEWAPAHATFGIYGWSTGPLQANQLPLPLAAVRSGADPLSIKDWSPVSYSLSRGIYKDLVHQRRFGPRGYVPEEFLDFGIVKAGMGVQYRTTFRLDRSEALHLCVSAPGRKLVWLDGKPAGESAAGDMFMAKASLSAGAHLLEFRIQPPDTRAIRAYWSLVRKPDRFARPEWLTMPGRRKADSRLHFSASWQIPSAVRRGSISFAVENSNVCGLRINGHDAGWVDERARVQPVDVTALLKPGANEIAIEIEDNGRFPPSAFADGMAELENGQAVRLMTGPGWKVRRDAGPERPAQLAGRRGNSIQDAHYLHRRPHPLPEAAWLERVPQDDTVAPVTPDAFPSVSRTEWLRWVLPPGAVEMRLPLAGEAEVFVNDAPVTMRGGRVALPDPGSLRRVCTVRVHPSPGRTAGALLSGPVTYEARPGRMEPGDWGERGLDAWSGGVWYGRDVELLSKPAGRVILELGRVRGTAEVKVNGQTAGACIMAPYRVEVGPYLRVGRNRIEVLILNTLGPYLKGFSATHFVFPGQEKSGLFGPVRLLAYES